MRWISTWINNHIKKLSETYFIYSLLLILPILFYKFKYKLVFFSLRQIKNIQLFSYNFKVFYFPIFFSNILWLFYFPAYRFGIYYNLTLILFLIIPFWIKIYGINRKLVFIFLNLIILISIIFYLFNCIYRVIWYLQRYEYLWPPIVNNNLIVI